MLFVAVALSLTGCDTKQNDVELKEAEKQLSTDYKDMRYEYLPVPEPPYNYSKEYDKVMPDIITVPYERVENFFSTWAKNDNYFFLPHANGVQLLPLNDISQGEIIHVPGDWDTQLVGLTEEYLFVSRRIGEWEEFLFDTYRISLESREVVLLDSGKYAGAPFYHAASNSLIFVNDNLEWGSNRNPDETAAWIEQLNLDTLEHHIIYEFESFWERYSDRVWTPLTDGSVIFFYNIWDGFREGAYIDANMQAQNIRFVDFVGLRRDEAFATPQNPAEEFINELGWVFHHGNYAIIGNEIYYLWNEQWSQNNSWRILGNLYRINIDGTGNTQLTNENNFLNIVGLNNTLIVTMLFDWQWDGGLIEVAKLSLDGNIEKIIGAGWDGHNSTLRVERLLDTDFIMIMEISGFSDTFSIQGIYCTNTGALFTLYNPEDFLRENELQQEEDSIYGDEDIFLQWPLGEIWANSSANVTSAWAKTDTHIYYVNAGNINRRPFDDITQHEQILIPGEGWLLFAGISENYIYLSRERVSWDDFPFARSYDIYRILLETLEVELIHTGEYYSEPILHVASNSLVFVQNDHAQLTGQIETLQLDTGERSIIYEFEPVFGFFDGVIWRVVPDYSLFIATYSHLDTLDSFVLDKDLNVQKFSRNNFVWFDDFVAIPNWAIEYVYIGEGGHDTGYELVLHSRDGTVRKIIGGGWLGNGGIGVTWVYNTDIILILESSWMNSSWVQGLYCMRTNTLLSSYSPGAIEEIILAERMSYND